MSNTRLDKQAENALQQAVDGLALQLDEIRSSAPQYVGGTSIKYYNSQAAGQFDWNGLLPDASGLGIGGKLFLITATAQNMNTFYGGITITMYQNTPTSLYDGLAYMNDYKAGNSVMGCTFTDAPNDTTQPAVKKWFAQVSGDSTKQLWVKFTVIGLDQATITITALS